MHRAVKFDTYVYLGLYLLHKRRYLDGDVCPRRSCSKHHNTAVLERLWLTVIVGVHYETVKRILANTFRNMRFKVMPAQTHNHKNAF